MSAIVRFWFAPESPRPVALLRIALGLVLLADCLVRWPHVVEMYSTAGAPLPLYPDTPLHPPELAPLPSVLLYGGLLFALACVALGWQMRLSLLAAAALLAWFGLLDYAGTLKKYTAIGVHLLVLLAFTQCGSVWSMDRLFDPRSQVRIPLSPAWPRRLMQILFCIVYLGAAVTKYRTPDFANGDLLYFSLLDPRWGGERMGMWLATQPKLLVLASYATVLFEAAFPLLVWIAPLRRPMIILAAIFHLMMGAVMTLALFTPVMLAALCAFLDERDLRLLTPRRRTGSAHRERFSSAAERNGSVLADNPVEQPPPSRVALMKSASFAAYLLACGGALSLGYLHQRSADWYGVFRGTPAAPLSPVSDDQFALMTTPVTPRNADYIYRIELGERFTTHHTFGRSTGFRPGERAWLLVRLIKPHPPMRVDFEMAAIDGSFRRAGAQFVPAEAVFMLAPIDFDSEHQPGKYEIVLMVNGFVAASKSFDVLPAE